MSDRGRATAIVAAFVALASAAWLLRGPLFAGNLQDVVPGAVYRSAQPQALAPLVDRLSLRSILNLRGPKPARAWYGAEEREARELGISLYSIRLSGRRLPSRQDLRRIVALLDTAPRPLLIHCRNGVDRSGLVSAIAVLLAGGDLAAARDEFAVRFGYVGAVSRSDLADWIDLYAQWLSERSQSPGPDAVRRFAAAGYVPYFYDARIEVVDPPARVAAEAPAELRFRVTNRSPRPWRFTSRSGPGVRLALGVQRVDAPAAPVRWLRGDTPDAPLEPGESILLSASLPPLDHGRHQLTVDLVDEGVTLFRDMGSEPLQLELDAGASGRR
jgi:protein tyrosine phosphatase (PTP) superfamily phosphohydrolase (DUF442 family)